MLDTQLFRLGEFYIGVDLLLDREIRLSDDRLRVDDEICILSQILRLVSDLDLEPFRAESVEKWRIRSIRTRYTIAETLVVASESRYSDPTDTDDMEMFLIFFHESNI
jgi:hypothetical protein